jgi:glycerol uptake facilitator-like aquaporin
VYYCAAQFVGAFAGVALASLVLQNAPGHRAVHYADTMLGGYGDRIAFLAELAISLILMSAVLFTSDYSSPVLIHFALPPS